MRKATRRHLTLAAAGVVGLLPFSWTPALAAQPDRAGPQTVTVLPLVGDPVVFVCGDRVLRFSAGTLTERLRELSPEEGRGTRHAVDARLSDGAQTYRFVGHSAFRFVGGRGFFHVTGVIRGADGTETVNARLTVSGDAEPVLASHGTCGIREERSATEGQP